MLAISIDVIPSKFNSDIPSRARDGRWEEVSLRGDGIRGREFGTDCSQRTLTEEEVSMLLVPTLNALEYLHANGLVHGHIKPSDIMAMGDRLKVSMDGVRKPGEAIDAAGAPVGAGVASGNAGNANGGGSVGTRGGRDE